MEMNWKKGDLLFIRAHTFVGGKGLSYEAGVYEAAEDGFSGGWDVFDSTIDISFYGFSVEKVQRKEEERMKVYIVWDKGSEYDRTPPEMIQIYQTQESAKKREAEEAQKFIRHHEKIMQRFGGSVKPDTEHPFWIEEREVEQ